MACAVKEGFDVKEWTLLCGCEARMMPRVNAGEKCTLNLSVGR